MTLSLEREVQIVAGLRPALSLAAHAQAALAEVMRMAEPELRGRPRRPGYKPQVAFPASLRVMAANYAAGHRLIVASLATMDERQLHQAVVFALEAELSHRLSNLVELPCNDSARRRVRYLLKALKVGGTLPHGYLTGKNKMHSFRATKS